MVDDIVLHILGDYAPFSRMGKSIGYQITIGESIYLIDCGAPLFQQIGGHGLKKVNGLIITHCHDDHKRWFTDLALFNMYAPDMQKKVSLLTSEDVNNELIRASGPAIEKSLSKDSKNIIDICYEEYIDYQILGPLAKYRIVSLDEGGGKSCLYVMDRNNNILPPDRAKIVISERTKKPRLLFKDPDYLEWVEPDAFYPFSSSSFYEGEKNIYRDDEGFTIEAIKSAVWHGVSGIGLRIKTNSETLVFSSDTAHNEELWRSLWTDKRTQRFPMSRKEFESSSVIYGNINDYIERIWSEERYKEAINAFNDATVIHDISVRNSIVHTDYEALNKTGLKKDSVMLTHSPDKITSEWLLCKAGKSFKIKGGRFFEIVDDRLYPMNADIYHKEGGKYYAGYKNEKAKYTVYEDRGLLRLAALEEYDRTQGIPLYNVELYEDISGKYFPKIEKPNTMYFERPDGRIEIMEFTAEGSKGAIVENHRHDLHT
ncbi:MAG: hypothetical protein AB1630_07870 [bacterium]